MDHGKKGKNKGMELINTQILKNMLVSGKIMQEMVMVHTKVHKDHTKVIGKMIKSMEMEH